MAQMLGTIGMRRRLRQAKGLVDVDGPGRKLLRFVDLRRTTDARWSMVSVVAALQLELRGRRRTLNIWSARPATGGLIDRPAHRLSTAATPGSGISRSIVARSIRLEGVGQLTDMVTAWRLTYDICQHVQLFARKGLTDPEVAAAYAQRGFSECLICRAAKARPPLPGPGGRG